MNKKRIAILSVLTLSFMFTPYQTKAATVIDNGDSAEGSCSTYASAGSCVQIFKKWHIGVFGEATRTNYVFKVSKVDAAGDRIYCDRLGNWIPAAPLIETNSKGDSQGNQILAVGEYFIIPQHEGDAKYKYNTYFYIHNIDAPTDSVQVYFKDKWGNTIPTWVYAEPMTRICDPT